MLFEKAWRCYEICWKGAHFLLFFGQGLSCLLDGVACTFVFFAVDDLMVPPAIGDDIAGLTAVEFGLGGADVAR